MTRILRPEDIKQYFQQEANERTGPVKSCAIINDENGDVWAGGVTDRGGGCGELWLHAGNQFGPDLWLDLKQFVDLAQSAFVRLYATVYVYKAEESRRVLRKLGFHLEGIQKQRRDGEDAEIWAKIRGG